MAFQVSGQMLEVCNCTLLCPCWFDTTIQPDQGWCGTAILFDIEQGNVMGLNLAGRAVVLAADIPGAVAEGNLVVRLYMGRDVSAEQQRVLEQVFTGQLGGPMAALGPAVTKLLPTIVTDMTIQRSDTLTVTAGHYGRLQWAPRRDPQGRATTVEFAEAMALYGVAAGQPAKTTGSHWSDPDMRPWTGDSGMVSKFSWKG